MSDFKAKMCQIQFRLGLHPRPCWRSLQRSTDPLARVKGPTSKGRGENKREGRDPLYIFLRIYTNVDDDMKSF